MDSFEQACVDTKRLAEGAVTASTKVVQAAKELVKAADDGDVAKIARATEKLGSASAAAREHIANAQQAWPLTPDEEERLLSETFEDELIAAGAEAGLPIRRHEQRLIVFPSVVRVLPSQRAVKIDRKRVTAIRPSKLVQVLHAAAAKKPKLAPERFIETLHQAYELVIGPSGYGTGTTLDEVYKALTMIPDVKRDYSISDFTRDVFVLDRSGVTTTRSGARLALPAATGTKGRSKVLEFVDQNGAPVTYYGIRFTVA